MLATPKKKKEKKSHKTIELAMLYVLECWTRKHVPPKVKGGLKCMDLSLKNGGTQKDATLKDKLSIELVGIV